MATTTTAAAVAEGDGGSTVVARLFVGGLAEGVSAADLEAVFGSIGRVAGVEFVRTSGRCFAYVDFHCPSDKALAKLFSTYNGCKWKGGKLKLEKAKEHYLVRLKREWELEAAAAQEVPAEENVEKQEDKEKEKQKLEKDGLDLSKVNIYFPKLRKLRPLPFKGSGKHKYSFRNIEVPSYPIHFCDCEEHCGPPEKANEEYAAALNRVASEKERSIMNSVMSKLLEKDNEQIDAEEVQKHDDDVNIASDAETEPSDTDTEPSDTENDLRMDETEETLEEDLDEIQMEETDEPSEEELDDDLVINIVPRKANKSAVQPNSANQAVKKDGQFRKRQQFEETSAQNKRQKSEDLSEPRNKKQSTSLISDRRTTVKSLPAISGAIQDEQKSLGLSVKGTHGFSSVLDRAKSSAGLQGALTGSTTKKECSQSEPATEAKKGSLWTQKSAWRDLVGGMGGASFSISQVLPNTNPIPPPILPTGTETSVARAESRKKVTFNDESVKFAEAITQPSVEQTLLPSSIETPSTGHTVGSAGHDTEEHGKDNKVQEARVVPKITISEVCPFMRNKESEQQWSKAKKVLTGFNKKGEEKTGSSNSGRGKPSSTSRRR